MFISNAYAQGGDALGLGGGGLMSLWPFLAMFAAMYFLMIRPQMKRQKETKAMLDALTKGDEVVTAGGLLGKVTKISDAYISLEVANGTEMMVQRSAITMLLPKGTLKTL